MQVLLGPFLMSLLLLVSSSFNRNPRRQTVRRNWGFVSPCDVGSGGNVDCKCWTARKDKVWSFRMCFRYEFLGSKYTLSGFKYRTSGGVWMSKVCCSSFGVVWRIHFASTHYSVIYCLSSFCKLLEAELFPLKKMEGGPRFTSQFWGIVSFVDWGSLARLPLRLSYELGRKPWKGDKCHFGIKVWGHDDHGYTFWWESSW